jgi:hypothetical protein
MSYNRTEGGALTQDYIKADLLNDYGTPHQIAVSGAIDPHTPGRFMFTKSSAAAVMTLGAPVAGVEDGLKLQFVSNTDQAHTITATGLYQDGAGNANLATFAAHKGASLVLEAFGGKWNVLSNNNVTFS